MLAIGVTQVATTLHTNTTNSHSLLTKDRMCLPAPRLPIGHNRPVVPLAHGIHYALNPVVDLHLGRVGPVHRVVRERLTPAIQCSRMALDAAAVPAAVDNVHGGLVVGTFELEDRRGGLMELAAVERADA